MKQTSAEFASGLAVPSSDAVLPHARPRNDGAAQPVLAVTLALIPVIAAVPVGSHRPIYWMIWTVVIACLVIAVIAQGRHPLRLPIAGVGGLAVVFLAACGLQLLPIGTMFGLERPFISIDTGATALATLRWASYAGFFWLMCQASRQREQARLIAWVLFLGIFLHAIWALVAFRFLGDAALWGPKLHYQGSVTGTFVNRNAYAVFLGFGLILGLGLLSHAALKPDVERRRMAVLFSAQTVWSGTLWLCLGVIALALFGTASRFGVFASLLAALVLVGALAAKHSGSGRFTARVVGWWSLVVLALFAIVGRPALERAVFTQIDSQDRVSLYVQVIDLIRQQPLTGVGLDVFETAFQGVHRTPMSPDLAWDRAHSTYLALWAEMGLIVGSIPPLICLIIAVTLITRFMRAKRDFVFVAIALSAITLGAIHSLVDFSLEIAANVYVFLALVALGATRATGQGAGERS